MRTSVFQGRVYEHDILNENLQDDEYEYEGEPEELTPEQEDELASNWDSDGPSIYLFLQGGKSNTRLNINLSDMTFEEIIAAKAFLDLAFNKAVKAVRSRDRKTREDAKQGKFTHPRLYRQLPEFVIRPRLQRGYGRGIPVGSLDVLAGKFLPEHFADRDAEQGSPVAEPEQGFFVSQDSGTQNDEPASVLEVVGRVPGTVSGGVQTPDGSTDGTSSTPGRDD